MRSWNSKLFRSPADAVSATSSSLSSSKFLVSASNDLVMAFCCALVPRSSCTSVSYRLDPFLVEEDGGMWTSGACTGGEGGGGEAVGVVEVVGSVAVESDGVTVGVAAGFCFPVGAAAGEGVANPESIDPVVASLGLLSEPASTATRPPAAPTSLPSSASVPTLPSHTVRSAAYVPFPLDPFPAPHVAPFAVALPGSAEPTPCRASSAADPEPDRDPSSPEASQTTAVSLCESSPPTSRSPDASTGTSPVAGIASTSSPFTLAPPPSPDTSTSTSIPTPESTPIPTSSNSASCASSSSAALTPYTPISLMAHTFSPPW